MTPVSSKIRFSLFSTLISVACVLHTANAANWYVDSAAISGSKSGISWANAWLNLSSISWGALNGGDVVWIQGGPYVERLTVGKSGPSRTARIILKGVNLPVIRGGIDGGTQDNIAVIGFEITQSSTNAYSAIRLGGCDGWLIQDNYIHDTFGSGIDLAYNTVNSFNIIRRNRFENICLVSGGASSGIVVQVYGDSNLVEYNSVTQSLDRTRVFGAGNVVRNNYYGLSDTVNFPNTSPYPHHTDALQSYESTRVLSKLLFERNVDIDNKDSVGGTNAHHFIIQDGTSVGINWIISRFNLLVRPGGTAFQLQNFTRFYVYNMTSIAIQNQAPSIWGSAVSYDNPGTGAGMNIQDFRNNTWSYSPKCVDTGGVISPGYRGANFTSDYQHAFNVSGNQPRLPADPHNLPANTNPLFSDINTDNYSLQIASPLRGAGGPITTASGSGADSTSLTVADSKRIFDGWGIADADWIKIGAGALVQVLSIDYSSNIVTLASPRSWNLGDGVFVKGSEDIGALPFAYAKPFVVTNTTPSLVVGSNTLSATVDNPDAVRMVEFLVDGIPVGIDYIAPYSTAYNSDGNAHTVMARAYAAWATQIPVSEAAGTGPAIPPTGAITKITTQ